MLEAARALCPPRAVGEESRTMLMPWGWGMGGGWGFGRFGMVLMLLCWVLIIAGSILVVQWVIVQGRPGGAPAPGGESAVDILKKRSARGDIGKEEYERLKQDLS
jgi:putative membrane protein